MLRVPDIDFPLDKDSVLNVLHWEYNGVGVIDGVVILRDWYAKNVSAEGDQAKAEKFRAIITELFSEVTAKTYKDISDTTKNRLESLLRLVRQTGMDMKESGALLALVQQPGWRDQVGEIGNMHGQILHTCMSLDEAIPDTIVETDLYDYRFGLSIVGCALRRSLEEGSVLFVKFLSYIHSPESDIPAKHQNILHLRLKEAAHHIQRDAEQPVLDRLFRDALMHVDSDERDGVETVLRELLLLK